MGESFFGRWKDKVVNHGRKNSLPAEPVSPDVKTTPVTAAELDKDFKPDPKYKDSSRIVSEVLVHIAENERNPKQFKDFERTVNTLADGRKVYLQKEHPNGDKDYFIMGLGPVTINPDTKLLTYEYLSQVTDSQGNKEIFKVEEAPQEDPSRPGEILYDATKIYAKMEALKAGV